MPQIVLFRPSFLWVLKKTSANSFTALLSCLAAGEGGNGIQDAGRGARQKWRKQEGHRTSSKKRTKKGCLSTPTANDDSLKYQESELGWLDQRQLLIFCYSSQSEVECHPFPLHWAGLSDLTGRECSRSYVLEFLRPNYKDTYSKNLLKHLVLKHFRRPEPPWKISSYRDMTKVGANMSGIMLILPAEPNLPYQGPKQRTKPWSPPAGCHLRACMLSLVQRFCNPMACSPPSSSVHGIFQARILEWVTIFCFKDLPNPGIEPPYPASPALAGGFFTKESWEAAWEAQCWGRLWSTVNTWDEKMGPTLFQLLLGFRNKKHKSCFRGKNQKTWTTFPLT